MYIHTYYICVCTHTIYMHAYTYIHKYVHILCINLGRKCDSAIGQNLEKNECGSRLEQYSLHPCIKYLNNFKSKYI